MLEPAVRNEIEEITGYLAAQLEALRTAAHGLTEDQARLTPCRSALSIAGLVKHVTRLLRRWPERANATPEVAGRAPSPAEIAAFMDSFAIRQDETFAGTMADYDEAVTQYLTAVRVSDPDADAVEPPAPWFGRPEPVPTRLRYQLLHHIEEFARHAGHADIIREQIDGASAAALDAAVQGRPANGFVTPWSQTETQAETQTQTETLEPSTSAAAG